MALAPQARRSVWLLLLPAVLFLPGGIGTGAGVSPYSPEEALQTFRLEPGFRIELVAAEPLISDPVAMEVDEFGRIYVVEMHGYPLDTAGSGRVMLLRDADGDGRADRSTVFADGLRLPTGIMRWKKGVLVTDSPEVWYLEDTDGDGRADVRRVVLTGFALSNPQHNTNSPVFGLDNWIYLANEGVVRTVRYHEQFGDEGTAVRFPDRPGSPVLPPDADGRNVRFRPDTGELEMLAARSQFGQAFDAWGRHFLVTNNRHIYHEVVPARYLTRNPHLPVPTAVQQLPDYGLPARVFPITENPEHQMLTDVGIMTSASGLTRYLGGLFPAEYADAAFVAEGAHNLVHAARVRPDGASFRASRMRDDREFLASTDSWFRPVNFYIGPDGALYLIDYYRKIIEHPEWLDDATAASGDLYAGRDRGRIYRIVPEGTAAATWVDRLRLGEAAPAELVQALEHPNVWWRRTAQRLLVDRASREAVEPLRRLARTGRTAEGRVHALWTLQGLDALDPRLTAHALDDPEPGVRENAVRLAELQLAGAPWLVERLPALAEDPDPRVRFQALLTLGGVRTAAAAAARQRLLLRDVDDPWMQVAALSAPVGDPVGLLAAASARLTDRQTPGRRALFERLGTLVGAGAHVEAVRGVVRTATEGTGPASGWWRAAILRGVAAGVAKRELGAELDRERARLLQLLRPEVDGAVRRAGVELLGALGPSLGEVGGRVRRTAAAVAADPAADPELRADAVRLLTSQDVRGAAPLLQQLLTSAAPTPVQVAAARALGRQPGPAAARFLLRRWAELTPAVREEAVRALAREPERLELLVEAVEAGRVRAAEVERGTQIRLMMSREEALRARARALFAISAAEADRAVERYRGALALPGNVERGRQVFARACASCHQRGGEGGAAFGPDLGEVRNRHPRALVADILNPSRSLADGFELWVLKLTDGSTASGVVAAETPTAVTLRGPGGAETIVPRSDIVAMEMSDVSAMPEGLEAQIAEQQMADLIAFLRSAP